MEQEFWQTRWARNEIGFHLAAYNPYLLQYWPALALCAKSRVLVPLAGKSMDLHWLRGQGHEVIAIELSRLAAERFFAEAGMAPRVEEGVDFACYSTSGITYYVGDFFTVSQALIGPLDAVYDRAALIALPPPMRRRYADAITSLQQAGTKTLLVGFEYAQHEMDGPPFAVGAAEVQALFGETHCIRQLACADILAQEPRFKAKGVSALAERIYCLTRLNAAASSGR